MKPDGFNLPCGNKGIIFSLDLMVGITIAFIVVAITLFFVSQGSSITLAEHQLIRFGSDIVTVMDQQEIFDTLDQEIIETEMKNLLPGNYDMLIRLQGNFSRANGTIEIGGEIPESRLTITGRKAALTGNGTYFKITYFVWARKQ